MAGINALTGKVLEGWPHVVQSIGKIMCTRLKTRLMLREFGSQVGSLQDAPGTPQIIMRYFVAIAEALVRWEPRFELTDIKVVEQTAGGVIEFELSGNYYPRGHLGDRSIRENRSGVFAIAA